jgi:hypothetical protein
MENVTCYNYTQPLDHFNPGSNNLTFEQRYCIYTAYDDGNGNGNDNNNDNDNCTNTNKNPIFFYTGNESPIDEYVNNTGLIWELGPKFKALIVFVEHRYEGTSVPNDFYDSIDSTSASTSENTSTSTSATGDNIGCFTYLTTTQTLADYASLLSYMNPNHDRAVITFGGSYGGMLSSWMKIMYGSIIAGSIASSAPVWGFPKTLLGLSNNDNYGDDSDSMVMDSASYVVGQALLKNVNNTNYSKEIVDADADVDNEKGNRCFQNLLATWPLIKFYGQSTIGRQVLSDQFRLCTPLQNENDVLLLLEWAQSPWFDLAEGDFPYPSSYIPYALGEGLHDLPAWPLQEACHGSSGLNNDFGISMDGSLKDVHFDIHYGQDSENELGLTLSVDWDEVHQKILQVNNQSGSESESNSAPPRSEIGDIEIEGVKDLLVAVREAVAIWFNVTKTLECFEVIPAINEDSIQVVENNLNHFQPKGNVLRAASKRREEMVFNSNPTPTVVDKHVCQQKIDNETVWSSLVCNDNINLIMTYGRGLGRDFYWPPSHPKNQTRYQDTISDRTEVENIYQMMCSDPDGIYGYPDKSKADPYSIFMDNLFGGLRVGHLKNMIFSNGLLDPWSAAGVYSLSSTKKKQTKEDNVSSCSIKDRESNTTIEYDCSMVQNITKDGSVVGLLLDYGAHHLDLMYSSDQDPTCAKVARLLEEEHISKWINEWNEGQQYHGSQQTCSTP